MPRPAPPPSSPKPREPAEDSALRRRFLMLGALSLAVMLLAAGRLAVLGGAQFDYWQARAEANFLKPRPIDPPRGLMVDRAGRPVASNLPVFDVYVRRYRQEQATLAEAMRELARLSGRPLILGVDEVMHSWPSWRPVPLLRGVPLEAAGPLLERLGGWSCLEAQLRYERSYPLGRAAAQVTGYLRQIPGDQLEARLADGYLRSDLVGWTGLEAGWEDRLRGRHGSEVREADALNRELGTEIASEAQPGDQLELTLDARLQRLAYDLLAEGGQPGSVVALDPLTGGILAIAAWPSFDPNTRRIGPGDSEWFGALRTAHAPASTMKLFSSVAILEGGRSPNDTYFCGGYFSFPNWAQKFHCDNRGGCGRLDLYGALRRSCNVFFFRGANEIGGGPLLAAFERFGFGRATGVEGGRLGIESRGTLHDGATAYPGDVIMAAIGQGQVSATPLQVARATAALANGGTLYTPYLVEAARAPDGGIAWRQRPLGERIALRPDHRDAIVEGLRQVVSREGGTAARVGFDPAWDVAGKTGTAERKQATDAWFTCFAPAGAPRIVVTVSVEEAGHGATGAAPIARDLLAAFFAGDADR